MLRPWIFLVLFLGREKARFFGQKFGKRPSWCTRSMRPIGIPGRRDSSVFPFTCDPEKRDKATDAIEGVLRARLTKGFSLTDLNKSLPPGGRGSEINTRKT